MQTDKSKLYTAVGGWIKWIETGNFSGMDRDKVLELAKGSKDMQRVASELPSLSEEQKHYLEDLRDLQQRVLKGEVEL